MARLLLCAFAIAGGFALSCQVLPGGGPSGPAGSAVALHPDRLPAVSAAPPTAPLSGTLAGIEGHGTPADTARETAIRRVVEILEGRHTGLSSWEVREVAQTIVDESAARGLEVSMVMAVISVESAGYHRAVSPVGALGLMQIMPETGAELARKHGVDWYGPETLFDAVVNVRLGIAYLQELSDRYDHVPTVLAAYNWGPGRIDRRIRQGVAMPRLYVEQVMRAYDDVIVPAPVAEPSSS